MESDHTDSESDLISLNSPHDSGIYELSKNLMTPSLSNYQLCHLDSLDNQDDKVSNRGESPQPGSHLNIRNTNTNLRNLKRLSKSDSALNSNMNDSQELNTRTISTIRTNNTVERGTSTFKMQRRDFGTKTEDKSTTDLLTSTNLGPRIFMPQSNEVNNRAATVTVPTSFPNELYVMPAQNVSFSKRHKLHNSKSQREKISVKQSAVAFGSSVGSSDRDAWLRGARY